MLFVNADDLGRTRETTDRIMNCHYQGRINSASAMTFMEDSERAAELARKVGLPVGLHLNLTLEFTGANLTPLLRDNHRRVSTYLRASKVNQVLFNPFLRMAFEYVFRAEWDEFTRLYGKEPTRMDGHHHMHLCMNMLASFRIRRGIRLRRNFTFGPGEKGFINRLYRYMVDTYLSKRFEITEYFFPICPIEEERLTGFVSLSKKRNVEIMVHPRMDTEYRYLMSDKWLRLLFS